jgi:DMSO/TMAO reductase YedYZ molybdopterin-dependent catalytic subunit
MDPRPKANRDQQTGTMKRVVMDPVGPLGRRPLEPHQLLDRMTRSEDMIVLCHLGVARVEVTDWSLSIDGMVRRPLRLTLDEIEARPQTTITTIHQCCGSPMKPDEPTRRITNVSWTGVRLSELLGECEPDGAARFVWSSGADHGVIDGIAVDAYVKDLPVERVADDVLIAHQMNGAPLTAEHGYPVRLVVPGFYGTNSVKWLTRMTLADARATGPFTTRWYNDPIRDESGKPTGATTPVWSIAPESVIVSPGPEATVAAGESTAIWGWAWADGGVDVVDVSFDGAATWTAATLEPASGRAWQRFTAAWRPERRGRHELCSRARSGGGRVQPLDGARNAIHCVPVAVA